MASLEMKTSLAADLPQAHSSPIRRSYTLNPRKLQDLGRGRSPGSPLSPSCPQSPPPPPFYTTRCPITPHPTPPPSRIALPTFPPSSSLPLRASALVPECSGEPAPPIQAW